MIEPIREGHISVPGGEVWYKIVGSGGATPLLTLHGGPGAGHDYLEPLEALAADRPVVFFDQLGCGKSDKPDDASLWRIERFVEEVAAVREALDLERVHLFGQSWGGWLAIEYMMSEPAGIRSLILASTSASVPQFAEETARLKSTLPKAVLETLNRYEATGDYDNPEYEEAMMAFYTQFVCRLEGPNEFTITGNLKDWDRTDRLGEINVRTLITCGRYDELGPACAATLDSGISNSEVHIFEQSAHVAHLEETESYLQVMRDFLNRVE
jgi:pimeloyl-ACP methyl ester carboxylesterase